jgi:uncharacterized protein YbbK (DUF523 family)
MRACLSDIQCRYDGSSNIHNSILNMPGILLIPLFTEQLGGLATALPSAHLVGAIDKQLRVTSPRFLLNKVRL